MNFVASALAALLALASPASAQIPGMRAGVTATAGVPWTPTAEFGTDWDSYWSTKVGLASSGGNTTTWTATGTVGRVATAVATGAPVGATLPNGFPTIDFSNSITQRMSFPTTGLATGTPNVTLFVCGGAANTSVNMSALSIGSAAGGASTIAIRSMQITGGPTAIQRTTGQYAVPSNNQSTQAQTQIVWQNNYRIVIGEFLSSSMTKQTVDGDANLPAYPWIANNNVSISLGRIGIHPTDTSPWNGPIQCAGIIKRALTQVQKDKLSWWLANEWGQLASLPATHPYKNTPPTMSDTLSSDLVTGTGAGGPMASQWSDGFTAFSPRTGTFYSGDTTGYNDPSAKGTWAFSGLNYMTSTKGGFFTGGQDVFITPSFNWAALDATFPKYGLVNHGPNGLDLEGSEKYPAVRQSAYAIQVPGGGWPYLSSLLTTAQSAKISPPFARKAKFRYQNPQGLYSFGAPSWSLGDRYNGSMNFTGSISGTTLTVSALGNFPTGQSLKVGTKLDTAFGGVLTNTRITALVTGAGGTGTYTLNISQTVSSQALRAFYPHQEMDDNEWLGGGNAPSTSSQHNHILIDGVDVGRGVNFPFPPGFPILGGGEIETTTVLSADYIYYLTTYSNGDPIITSRQAWPANTIVTDKFNSIMNMATGFSYEVYPGRFTGVISDGAGGAGNFIDITQLTSGRTLVVPGQMVLIGGISGAEQGTIQSFSEPGATGTGGAGRYVLDGAPKLVASTAMQMAPTGTGTGALTYTPKVTVRSIEYLAPPSNTSGVWPPAYPVPVVAWAGCCANGLIPFGTTGTVATITGASTYEVDEFAPAQNSHLVASGSNIVTSGSVVPGTYELWIRGCAADGSTCSGALTDGTPGMIRKTVVMDGATTFNAADCSSSGCGLSGGNLVVTNPNVTAWYGARVASAVGARKVYAEFAVNGIGGNTAVGVATNALNLNGSGLGGPGNSAAYYWNDQVYTSFSGDQTTSLPSGQANGTIVGLAIDGVAKKAWWRVADGTWNAGLGGTQDPGTSTGGFDLSTFANIYPFVVAYGGGAGNGLTANFGSTQYTYTVPPGFTGLQ